MRKESVTLGRRQLSYLVAETPHDTRAPRDAPYRHLVLLHAFPLSAGMWRPQLAAPPAGWRIVAPDYRGLGHSPLPPDAGTARTSDLAGDAIDLLDHLHITQAVVAGCSMGGYVAFELLEAAETYLSGLILIDTRAGADSDQAKAARRRMLAMIDEDGAAGVAADMVPKLLGATTREQRQDVVEEVRTLITANAPAGIKMAVTAIMERKDMTPVLSKIKIPTLVVHGAQDALIPPASAEEMHRAIKGSKLDIIEQAGHLPNLEQATPFNAAIQRFLQQF